MESATIDVGAREFRELRGAERDAALMVVARTARWCLAEMGRMVGEVIENGSFASCTTVRSARASCVR